MHMCPCVCGMYSVFVLVHVILLQNDRSDAFQRFEDESAETALRSMLG